MHTQTTLELRLCIRIIIAKCESEHQFNVLLAVENVKYRITVITNRSGRFQDFSQQPCNSEDTIEPFNAGTNSTVFDC